MPSQRSLAVFIACVIFITQSVLCYSPEANFWSQRRSVVLDSQRSSPVSLPSPQPFPHASLLSSLTARLSPYGVVRDVKLADPESVVIHIQDVHGNLEAQKNIGEMILSVLEPHPNTLVGLEGGIGAISFDEFRKSSNHINTEVGSFLLNTGLITGAEYAGFAAKASPFIVGLEDETLYLQNVDAVRKSLAAQEQALKRVSKHKTALQAKKKHIYTLQMEKFDQKFRAYQKGEINLGSYLTFLSSTFGQFETHENISRFLNTWDLEKSIDYERANAERSQFLSALSGRLNREAWDRFIQNGVALKSGALTYPRYYELLKKTAADAKVSLSQTPEFSRYITYVIQADAIHPERLLEELSDYETEIWNRLCKTPEQKALVQDVIRWELTEKLVRLTLTPHEWKRYLLTRTTSDFSQFEMFYKAAEARNVPLSQNFVRHIQNAKSPVAILVAGGFHSPGLRPPVEDSGATVITVTPKLTETKSKIDHPYLHVFTRDRTPLSTLFESPSISIPMQLAMQAGPNQNPDAAAARTLAAQLHKPISQALAVGRSILKLPRYVIRVARRGMAHFPYQGESVLTGQTRSRLHVSIGVTPSATATAFRGRLSPLNLLVRLLFFVALPIGERGHLREASKHNLSTEVNLSSFWRGVSVKYGPANLQQVVWVLRAQLKENLIAGLIAGAVLMILIMVYTTLDWHGLWMVHSIFISGYLLLTNWLLVLFDIAISLWRKSGDSYNHEYVRRYGRNLFEKGNRADQVQAIIEAGIQDRRYVNPTVFKFQTQKGPLDLNDVLVRSLEDVSSQFEAAFPELVSLGLSAPKIQIVEIQENAAFSNDENGILLSALEREGAGTYLLGGRVLVPRDWLEEARLLEVRGNAVFKPVLELYEEAIRSHLKDYGIRVSISEISSLDLHGLIRTYNPSRVYLGNSNDRSHLRDRLNSLKFHDGYRYWQRLVKDYLELYYRAQSLIQNENVSADAFHEAAGILILLARRRGAKDDIGLLHDVIRQLRGASVDPLQFTDVQVRLMALLQRARPHYDHDEIRFLMAQSEQVEERTRANTARMDSPPWDDNSFRRQIDSLESLPYIHQWTATFDSFASEAAVDDDAFDPIYIVFDTAEEEPLEEVLYVPKGLRPHQGRIVERYIGARINNRFWTTPSARGVAVETPATVPFERVRNHFENAHANPVAINPISDTVREYYGVDYFQFVDNRGKLRPPPVRRPRVLKSDLLETPGGSGIILAVNIGRTLTKVEVLKKGTGGAENETFGTVESIKLRQPSNAPGDSEAYQKQIISHIRSVLSHSNVTVDQLDYAIVGVSGIVKEGQLVGVGAGVLHRLSGHNLRAIRDIGDVISDAFGDIPVRLVHDGGLQARAATEPRNIKNALVARLGTSLASGAVNQEGSSPRGVMEPNKIVVDMRSRLAIHHFATGSRGTATFLISFVGIINIFRQHGLHNTYRAEIDDISRVPRMLNEWIRYEGSDGGKQKKKRHAQEVYTELGQWVAAFGLEHARLQGIDKVILGGSILSDEAGQFVIAAAEDVLAGTGISVHMFSEKPKALRDKILEGAFHVDPEPELFYANRIAHLSRQDGAEPKEELIRLTWKLIKFFQRRAKLHEHPKEPILQREAPVDPKAGEYLRGKKVLVTGAGGSIGQRLVEDLLQFEPSEIVFLGMPDDIRHDFEMKGPGAAAVAGTVREMIRKRQLSTQVRVEKADIRDKESTGQVFRKHEPQVVFHLAAQRELPKAERHVKFTIATNLMGTRNLAELADENGVERFVYASTEKARKFAPDGVYVNTKVLAETALQIVARESSTRFAVARFHATIETQTAYQNFHDSAHDNGFVSLYLPTVFIRSAHSIPQVSASLINAGIHGVNGEIYAPIEKPGQFSMFELALFAVHEHFDQTGVKVPIRFVDPPAGALLEEFQGDKAEPNGDVDRSLFSFAETVGRLDVVKSGLLEVSPLDIDVGRFNRQQIVRVQEYLEDGDVDNERMKELLRIKLEEFASNRLAQIPTSTLVEMVNRGVHPDHVDPETVNVAYHGTVLKALLMALEGGGVTGSIPGPVAHHFDQSKRIISKAIPQEQPRDLPFLWKQVFLSLLVFALPFVVNGKTPFPMILTAFTVTFILWVINHERIAHLKAAEKTGVQVQSKAISNWFSRSGVSAYTSNQYNWPTHLWTAFFSQLPFFVLSIVSALIEWKFIGTTEVSTIILLTSLFLTLSLFLPMRRWGMSEESSDMDRALDSGTYLAPLARGLIGNGFARMTPADSSPRPPFLKIRRVSPPKSKFEMISAEGLHALFFDVYLAGPYKTPREFPQDYFKGLDMTDHEARAFFTGYEIQRSAGRSYVELSGSRGTVGLIVSGGQLTVNNYMQYEGNLPLGSEFPALRKIAEIIAGPPSAPASRILSGIWVGWVVPFFLYVFRILEPRPRGNPLPSGPTHKLRRYLVATRSA